MATSTRDQRVSYRVTAGTWRVAVRTYLFIAVTLAALGAGAYFYAS